VPPDVRWSTASPASLVSFTELESPEAATRR
jgi:hypothetical protein